MLMKAEAVSPAVFIETAKTRCAGDVRKKRLFHVQAESVLRQLAISLGLSDVDYDLRHCLGGIAVSGEITLHGDHIYVQMAQAAASPSESFLWRGCRNRKDYTGGLNRWAEWDELNDLDRLAQTMLQQIRQEYRLCQDCGSDRQISRLSGQFFCDIHAQNHCVNCGESLDACKVCPLCGGGPP